MRGGQVFMETLQAHGVNRIFGNPGTTENSLLDRLIDYPDFDYIVTLHEGVAVGAASFYAQATGTTGVANLHVAPGLGNGIGMIYGALKANSPLIVTAGAQDTRMRWREPMLGHDLVAMAAPVTKWSAEPQSADDMAPVLRRAFQIANEPPCGPVFVALPNNVMEQETNVGPGNRGTLQRGATPDPTSITALVSALAAADRPAIVAGDEVPRSGAFDALVRLAERLGATVYHDGLRAQLSFPNRHPNYRGRVPFEADAIRQLLSPHDVILLVGGQFFEEVWYDEASPLPASARVIQLESVDRRLAWNHPVELGVVADLQLTLRAVADQIDPTAGQERQVRIAAESAAQRSASERRLQATWDATPMTPARAVHEVAQAVPPGTIVVDESITASIDVGNEFDLQRPGDFYAGRGGGIGQGVAGAIGISVAHPDRPVLAISGDGSAMYSIQALWSAAHHGLPIVFVILANREYRVLKHNLDIYRQRFDIASNKPYPHMDLTKPVLGFADIAKGMGVGGALVEEAGAIGDAIRAAFAADGPQLVEIVISGKEYGASA